MPWIVVTMIILIYNLIEVVGIIIRPPMVAQETENHIYALALLLKMVIGYLGLIGVTIYIYIFIVVWSFRFLSCFPESNSSPFQMK